MTIWTDGLITRPGRNILDDVVTGQFDAAEAAFDQAWFDNPTTSARRISELTDAEQGAVISPAYPAYGIKERRGDPATPLLTPDEARARVKESGLDISIPDTGIRQGALDILIERNQAQRERQLVLENAPLSTVPVQLLAGFAASAVDPINIASAFIPFVGEARYASMLASASGRIGRFAVRARVGAIQGAAGAALVEPLPLLAAQQDQTDYGLSDTLLNIAFGGVLGGGLHGVGGVISDARRGSLLSDTAAQVAAESAPGVTARRSPLSRALETGDDEPMVALRESLERGIESDRLQIAASARRQAHEELAPAIRQELEQVAAGRLPNVADLRAEAAAVDRRLSEVGDTYRVRAKEYQQQGMSRQQAETAARDAIATERAGLVQRQEEISEALRGNQQAEMARGALARLDKGELPEQFSQRVFDRADEIARGFDIRPAFRAVAESAPWYTRQSALKSAVAQAVTGRDVDVGAIFDLNDPALRFNALERLKQPQPRSTGEDGRIASAEADESLRLADQDELAAVEQQLADEQALTDEMADQAGVDVAPITREADQLQRDAETYAAAYRAAAVCQLRT